MSAMTSAKERQGNPLPMNWRNDFADVVVTGVVVSSIVGGGIDGLVDDFGVVGFGVIAGVVAAISMVGVGGVIVDVLAVVVDIIVYVEELSLRFC